jgi:hypothetical protein
VVDRIVYHGDTTSTKKIQGAKCAKGFFGRIGRWHKGNHGSNLAVCAKYAKEIFKTRNRIVYCKETKSAKKTQGAKWAKRQLCQVCQVAWRSSKKPRGPRRPSKRSRVPAGGPSGMGAPSPIFIPVAPDRSGQSCGLFCVEDKEHWRTHQNGYPAASGTKFEPESSIPRGLLHVGPDLLQGADLIQSTVREVCDVGI